VRLATISLSAINIADSLIYKAQLDLSAKVMRIADDHLGTLIDIKA
jgi:hypothetical protein